MATFNNEDLIKWNDLSTSLQDIIMRKITWNMLHPDLQSWLLDKERRIIELERWRRTKADPMLDDHERRIGVCEREISNLWNKLGDAEDDIDDMKDPPPEGLPGPDDPGFLGEGYAKFPNGFIVQWGTLPPYGNIGSRYKVHNFNKPFPNKAMAIAGSPQIVPGASWDFGMNELNWHIVVLSNSTFGTHHDETVLGFSWIAFGY